MVIDGAAAGLCSTDTDSSVLSGSWIVGTGGVETTIDGPLLSPVRAMVGTSQAISSGALIAGASGAETVISGTGARERADASCISTFRDSLDGFQLGSKLTMGLPGRSLTAEGVGSLGLLSLLDLLVAALMSSLLISMPSTDIRDSDTRA